MIVYKPMSTTLVTAIYYGDREGKYGGRCWQEQYYFSSFQNIYNFGLPTVVYTDDRGEWKIRRFLDYLDSVGVENKWVIKNSPIGDFKFADKICEHKKIYWDYATKEVEERRKTNPDEPGFFHARNKVLCHRKLYFLKDIADENPYDTDNVVWVDSGITHWGLNPFSKGGVEINNFFNKKHYYPYNKNNMYTPQIGKGINNLIEKHGMFTSKHNNLWYNKHHVKVLEELLQEEYGVDKLDHIEMQLVGGVIGIKPTEFKALFEFYEKALIKLAATRPPKTDFFTEEIILSAYWKIRNHFTLDFTEWNHDSKNDPSFVDMGEDPDVDKKIRFYKTWDMISSYA